MVNFGEFQKYGFHNFTIWDFENIDILKEREGYNLGDGKFSGFPKMRMSGESLKERDGDNLGIQKMEKGREP